MAEDFSNIQQDNEGGPFSTLTSLGGSGNTNSLSVDDVTSNDLFMTPEEINAYNDYQSYRGSPSSGMLPNSAYYPNIGNNIGVGNSSGSIIGSHTIYAPAAGLVPFGMMDARDAAIQRAALQKQKEVDAFRGSFRKAPTSKLVGINEDLTNEYFNFIDNSWKTALRKAGNDPNKATYLLKNDPNFWSKEKSYQDLAKRGDAVVNKIAEIDTRLKAGDVLSPSLVEAKNRVLMDMNPDSEGFKNLSSAILRMDADREFSKVAGDVLKDLVTSKTGRVYDQSNPNEIRILKEEIEKLSPEAIKSGLENLNTIYANSSMYSPEYIKRNWDAMSGFQKKDQDLRVSQKREPNADEVEYKVSDIANESDEISGNVLKAGSGGLREGKFDSFDRVTLRKPIKVMLPVGTKAVNLKKGSVPDENVENVQAEIGGIYNAYTYSSGGEADSKFNGMMLDQEQLKNPNLKKNATVTPMVTVRYKTKNEEGVEEVVSTQVPLSSVRNSLRGAKGQNEKLLKEIETRAQQKTQQLKQPAAGASLRVSVNGSTGEIPADQWEAFKKKYPSANKL